MAEIITSSDPMVILPATIDEKHATHVVHVKELANSSSSESDSDSDDRADVIVPSTTAATTALQHRLSASLDLNARHLISSPYPDANNQLDLSDLDTANRLFALALTALQPVRADYATAPYLDAFNWTVVFALLRELCQRAGFDWGADGTVVEREFYVVIFRSQLAPGIDRARLGELDQRSHEEACASGGLLKYWFGSPDAERRNLATCLWRNHDDAVAGGKGPWHAQARAAARHMYHRIDFHVHRLVIDAHAESWRLEKFR